jgi:hypothetical protein
MIAHQLFPTLIGDWKHPNPNKFKEILFDRVFYHIDQNGYSMETTGDVDLHLDKAFDPLFDFAADCAKEYINTLRLDLSVFNLNLVKTWLNIITEFHTPIHSHQDAHLSFVYYIQIPEGLDKPIYFSSENKPNELFYGMNNANVTEWNLFNSPTWFFKPVEGQLFMFPGKLNHYTGGAGSGQPDRGCRTLEDLKPRRISIAGDFLLTYNRKIGRAYGIQPVSNWRTFNGN